MYLSINIPIYKIKKHLINERKRPWICKTIRRDIWEGLEWENRKEKDIEILKNNRNKKITFY